MTLTRSEQMARIRSTDTSPEQMLRSVLWAMGFRYRLHAKTPAGRPDLVFPGRRLAVFIDGCFWHGCPDHYTRPRTREAYWADKLRKNVERDRDQTLMLENQGWRVVRLWEHEVLKDAKSAAARVEAALRGKPVEQRIEQWRVVAVHLLEPAEGLERRWLEELRDRSRTRTLDGPRVSLRVSVA